jgi:hypothetical protein
MGELSSMKFDHPYYEISVGGNNRLQGLLMGGDYNNKPPPNFGRSALHSFHIGDSSAPTGQVS